MIKIRTVKEGYVHIGGKAYYPSDQYRKYNGELENCSLAFGVYFEDNDIVDFISLWGTEAEYNGDMGSVNFRPYEFDGTLPWRWWYTKDYNELKYYNLMLKDPWMF